MWVMLPIYVRMNHRFSKLFNNNAMARILDVLIEKKDVKVITIPEIVEETNLSRRSVGDGLSLLKDMDLVDMDIKHLTKLYKVNKKAKLTKSLINLYNMINIEQEYVRKPRKKIVSNSIQQSSTDTTTDEEGGIAGTE